MADNHANIATVLFSKNWAGKQQAARFDVDMERARQAALKHAVSAVFFTAGDDQDLLAALPAGRYGDGDRPVLGGIKTEIFKKLADLAETQAKPLEEASEDKSADAVADADGDEAADEVPADENAGDESSQATAEAVEQGNVSVVLQQGKTAWPQLAKGDLVLAPEFTEGEYNGWWEATVVARSETHVTLEWKGYPDLANFIRPITQIAAMHPKCAIQA